LCREFQEIGKQPFIVEVSTISFSLARELKQFFSRLENRDLEIETSSTL
jgi:hypothetical protein